MNQISTHFQPYNYEKKQFLFVSKPRLSIQQLDIKFNKAQKKDILHRRKSQIDFRRLKLKKENNNQELTDKIKLPVISKKNLQLQIKQISTKDQRMTSIKKQKKSVKFLHAKSVNLFKRVNSNLDNYENQEQDKYQNNDYIIKEQNSPRHSQIEIQQQKNQENMKKFYISELNLNSIQNKEQLSRRSLIQKLILKKQQELKNGGYSGIVNNKFQTRFLKNYNFCFKQFSKQLQSPDEIFSKKLQISQKQPKIRLSIQKPNKPIIFLRSNGQNVQGWQTNQPQDDLYYLQ